MGNSGLEPPPCGPELQSGCRIRTTFATLLAATLFWETFRRGGNFVLTHITSKLCVSHTRSANVTGTIYTMILLWSNTLLIVQSRFKFPLSILWILLKHKYQLPQRVGQFKNSRGRDGIRTHILYRARVALSQLSYTPV